MILNSIRFNPIVKRHYCEWTVNKDRYICLTFDIDEMDISLNTLEIMAKTVPLQIRDGDTIDEELIRKLMS